MNISAALMALSILLIFTLSISSAEAQLSTEFYKKSCPKVFAAVSSVVKAAVAKEKRMAASLLRLHFHDCFIQGCDGSILLDDTPSFTGEKTAGPNINSIRGFEVIDEIKEKVEAACPAVVSCADIVTIAARDSVVQVGGPDWEVKVGRRDSKSASLSAANSGALPPPNSNLSNLINRFSDVALSAKDMVVLSGAHTIGQARCATFRARIYNEGIDPTFAKKRQANCPSTGGAPKDNNLAPLDHRTPNFFVQNLLFKRGLLHSDQVLYAAGPTSSLIETYAENGRAFDKDFVSAMIKMGDISPLTGSQGEIRKNCRKPN